LSIAMWLAGTGNGWVGTGGRVRSAAADSALLLLLQPCQGAIYSCKRSWQSWPSPPLGPAVATAALPSPAGDPEAPATPHRPACCRGIPDLRLIHHRWHAMALVQGARGEGATLWAAWKTHSTMHQLQGLDGAWNSLGKGLRWSIWSR